MTTTNPGAFRHTRIVCTIGPASQSEEKLRALLDAGMNVARLNFSHGTHASHQELYNLLRRLSSERGSFLAILQDLSGPKIRLGNVAEGTQLIEGEECVFTAEDVPGTEKLYHISYAGLAEEVEPGNIILLDDGLLQCRVEKIANHRVYTRVIVGGPLSSHKGVNLPGAKLSVQALTEKDADDLRFGLKMGVDYVAMSFVRQAADVEAAHAIMDEVGIHRPIIAKIEKPEAVENIEAIVKAFDGIMVARGDLGVEMPIEDIPIVQKRIIALARKNYRPVITATQMLDSMIRSPRPTRAEVTDIANAILDGTDAVMLSGETASGQYPLEAVQVMDRVARQAETCLPYDNVAAIGVPRGENENGMALAACEIAEATNSSAILACSGSGYTVLRVSHFRPRSIIVGVAHNLVIARQLSLFFGVEPTYVERAAEATKLAASAAAAAKRCGYVKTGDTCVLVAGTPPGQPTNFIHLMTVS